MDTYEKKYKEALGWMQSLYDGLHGKTKEEAERYFPELVESEDERVRKELITHCRNTRCVTEEGAERIAKWIAWLERQPKWSEEDEKCIDNCCLLIGAADDCYEKTFKDDCIHYLQSLKERIAWKPMPIKQKDIDDLVFKEEE